MECRCVSAQLEKTALIDQSNQYTDAEIDRPLYQVPYAHQLNAARASCIGSTQYDSVSDLTDNFCGQLGCLIQ